MQAEIQPKKYFVIQVPFIFDRCERNFSAFVGHGRSSDRYGFSGKSSVWKPRNYREDTLFCK
jgi:hypothetical protein